MENLMMAVMQGDNQKVEKIVNPENVNAKDENGRTPLMAAVFKNMAIIAEMLIKNGADINAVDNEGFSVLYYSAVHGNFESTFLLYESGVKMNKSDPSFVNILSAAKEQGHKHIVELLVAAEAKKNG